MICSNMRNKSRNFDNLAFRMSLFVAGVTFFCLLVGGFIETRYIKKSLFQNAEGEIEQAMASSLKAIDLRMEKIEAATQSIAAYSNDYAFDSVTVYPYLENFIRNNEDIMADFILYTEHPFDLNTYWVLFYFRSLQQKDSINCESRVITSIDSAFKEEGWSGFKMINSPKWSTPYDVKGYHSLVNYSIPLRKTPDGPVYAILGAEVSLDWIGELVSSMKPDSACDITIIGADGNYVCEPDSNLINSGSKNLIITKEIPRLGWTVVFTFPIRKLLSRAQPMLLIMLIIGIVLMVVLLLSILFCIRYIARPYIKQYQETTESRAVMEEELQIASNIQMGMLPKECPNLRDFSIDIHAVLHPAKQVGGDLYDFLIHDDKLFFCIGDVSGKGVPAALFMSEVRSLFHTLSYRLNDPAEIVHGINLTMSDGNEQCMFCTLFMGILDLHSRVLSFCNAGHNLPIILSDSGADWLPDESDRLLGVFPESKYHTKSLQLHDNNGFFLYTDGVTEAKNRDGKLWGNEAVMSAITTLKDKNSSQDFIDEMMRTIALFTAGAEQSDDITMMYIRINR